MNDFSQCGQMNDLGDDDDAVGGQADVADDGMKCSTISPWSASRCSRNSPTLMYKWLQCSHEYMWLTTDTSNNSKSPEPGSTKEKFKTCKLMEFLVCFVIDRKMKTLCLFSCIIQLQSLNVFLCNAFYCNVCIHLAPSRIIYSLSGPRCCCIVWASTTIVAPWLRHKLIIVP